MASTRPITPSAPPASNNEFNPINLRQEMIAIIATTVATIKLKPRLE